MMKPVQSVSLCALFLVACLPPSSAGSGSSQSDDENPAAPTRPTDSGVMVPSPTPQSRDQGVPQAGDASRPALIDFGPGLSDAGDPCNDRLPEGHFSLESYQAASQITEFTIPRSVEHAARLGCEAAGRNRGSGLSALFSVFGIDSDNPRETHPVNRVELLTIPGWEPGQSLNTAPGQMNWYEGRDQGDFVADVERINELTFDSECSTLRGEFSAVFTLTERTDTNPFVIRMEDTRLVLEIVPSPAGFQSTGVLSGYVTIGLLREMVESVQDLCRSDEETEYCDDIDLLFNGDPTAVVIDLILPLLGGTDAFVDFNGHGTDDCSGDCNAVSVCASIRGEPTLMVRH